MTCGRIYGLIALLVALGSYDRVAAEPRCVDIALVLAVDGSSSVDSEEYQFQKSAIANALRDSGVRSALRRAGAVALAVVFWGDGEFETQNLGWVITEEGRGLDNFADQIEVSQRHVFGNTDIGSGLWSALDMIAQSCSKRPIINVSGDGKETIAPKRRQRATLPQARIRAQNMGVTINALAIESDEPDLATYYAREVVRGTGGFTMEIRNYQDYAYAIRRKLIRELSSNFFAGLQ